MLEKSQLYSRLLELEKKEFILDSRPVSTKIINELLVQSTDILSRVSQYLPEYTLHDVYHSQRVLENIEKLIPSNIQLNIVEIQILMYAIFLHDIGMTSDKVEERLFKKYSKSDKKNKIKLLDDYMDNINKNSILDNNLTKFFQEALEEELNEYVNLKKDNKSSNDIFSEYIRIRHVHRSKLKLYLLSKSLDFDYKGISLIDHIYNVILSHGLKFSDLKNDKQYPTKEIISNKEVNILFLSILLRLGDLLDADISRTPKYLYNFFGFIDKKSMEKWKKNLSLVGKIITNYNLSFNYKSQSPEQERDIRRYIEFVENQILDTNKVLKYSNKKLNLSPIINLNVSNNGSYKSANKKITIEYEKVKKILMGTELYDKKSMFLRELIQNSRDACKMREYYSEELGITSYKPHIIISYNEAKKELKFKDNGIGMNESSMNNFFIKMGNSSYSKANFVDKYKFYPIGNFGIGILSVFMVSNEIKVNSIKFKNDGFFDKPVNFKLNIDEKYVVDYKKITMYLKVQKYHYY